MDEWTDDGRGGDLSTDSDSYFDGGDGDLTTESDASDLFTESDSDDEGKGATLDTSRYLVVKKVGMGSTATALLCLDLVEANRPVILKNTQKSRFRSLPSNPKTPSTSHTRDDSPSRRPHAPGAKLGFGNPSSPQKVFVPCVSSARPTKTRQQHTRLMLPLSLHKLHDT